MASKNQVTLTFAGDESDLERSFDRVGDSSKDMARDVGASSRDMAGAGQSFDKLGEASDNLDTKAMGFRDTMTGVQDTMAGTALIAEGQLFDGFLTLGTGIGDLASGVTALGAPLAKTVTNWVRGHAKMAATTVANVARQVAAWAVLGLQSLLNAAKVAAAWLISIGPLILVGIAVVALVILIVKNWDTIKKVIAAGWDFVKKVTVAAWDFVKETVMTVIEAAIKFVRAQIDIGVLLFVDLPRRVGSALRTVADMITAPFKKGFDGIKSAWNNTVGGKGFDVPQWVPIIGGKSFKIPKLHDGGTFRAPSGQQEGLALLRDGEEVRVPGRRPGAGGTVIMLNVVVQGALHTDASLIQLLNEQVQRAGRLPQGLSA